MATIAIATKNQVKIRAIEQAFKIFLGNHLLYTLTEEVDSDVSKQPFNDEVFMGAENRLKNLKAKLQKNSNIDYYISCEGGIIELSGVYYNIHYVIVEDKYGHKSTGIGQGYPVPKKYIEEIRETSIANVLDNIFDGKGGISQLTKGAVHRDNLIKDATIMSLTAIMNGELWNNS